MPHALRSSRRSFLATAAATTALGALPAWAQPGAGSRNPAVVQIADTSAGQIDITKDFLAGSRTAWQEINAKGGLRGKPVQHQILEVDGSAVALRAAVESLKNQSHVVALFGTVGAMAASQVGDILRRDLPDVAHIAPWLHQPDSAKGDNTFAIFASRTSQIDHAVKSLAVMGVTSLGAVYATPAEFATYRDEMEQTARNLKMTLSHFGPVADLQKLGQTLSPDSPRILIFLGGTPEMQQFTQGIGKQAAQRYIVGMSDVNLQVLNQLGTTKQASVIATQVVPMVNSQMPIVRSYREAMGRYLDEPPTPHSLAGYLSARYTFDALQGLDAAPSRASVLTGLQRRSSVELGGFRIDLEGKRRCGTYVTQSMITSDGRLLG
ncbi:MAG: twin-arginine translocation pathway signal protein [Burkholderiales bacterium PBB3]|nr:MAG: twin-arginine translocation pathway signal protein [Burkholderiales bacterium PBB3]